MPSRRDILHAIVAAATPGVLLQRSAAAQEVVKQVVVTVAFPAGGATDIAARMVADTLRGRYAASAIVENRAGAGGRIGTDAVRRAPADGSALLYTPAFPLLITPHVYSNLPYDTLRDFVPVALVSRSMLSLSVGPAVPDSVRSIPDFVAWCKAHPEQASFGAPAGSGQHFAGVMFGRAAGVDLKLINYKGGAPSIVDLLGGHIPATINPLAEALPHAQAGKLRLLATMGMRRSPFAPEVPSMQEFGYNEVLFQDWSGVFAPAGVPAATVARANEVINELVRSKQGIEAFGKLGAEPDPQTPEAFAAIVKADWERYRTIVQSTGFKAES